MSAAAPQLQAVPRHLLPPPPRSVGSAEQPSPVELVDRSRERGLEHVHLG
jgi:hypothetical protein